MIVTCCYDIYNSQDKVLNLIDRFKVLALSEIPITVFTDSSLLHLFSSFPNNVNVVCIPLDSFILFTIVNNYNRQLPNQRNLVKDTKEYFGLINTKSEFIKKTAEISNHDTFIWLDFGILKHIKNTDIFIQKLKLINSKNYNKMIMPGFNDIGCAFSCDSITSRFCGSFFIIPRKYVDIFFNHSHNVLRDFCNLEQYKLCWETNIWYIVEMCAMRNDIVWYFADTDDSILTNINDIISL